VQSGVTGFLLPEGHHEGVIGIEGAQVVWFGWLVSLAGLLGISAFLLVRKRRRARRAATDRRFGGPAPAVAGALSLILIVAFLGAPTNTPPASAASPGAIAAGGSWRGLDRSDVIARPIEVGGISATEVTADPGRKSYSMAEIGPWSPRSWLGSPMLYVYFKGEGSGLEYPLDVLSDAEHFASYDFADASIGWRVLRFSLTDPDRVNHSISWDHVTGIRVASNDRTQGRHFLLGAVLLGTTQVVR